MAKYSTSRRERFAEDDDDDDDDDDCEEVMPIVE